MSELSHKSTPGETHSTALHSAVRIDVISVLWTVIEGALAIGAGIVASSLLLTAFGIDSIIEVISGAILLWRLGTEAAGGDVERVEGAERRAGWVVFICLALLCLYVLASALYGLITHAQPEAAPLGIAVSAAAVVIMPLFALGKRRLAAQIESGALRGDAASSITCGYMAATVLVGLLLNTLFHWWWAEYVAALVFLFWLVRETREALEEAREAAQHKDSRE
jgi:divalent metal cation (Fe/Co/Zn/Cd) transporter